MPGFDITSILDFQPPRFICPYCRGLFPHFKWVRVDGRPIWERELCPVCNSEFVEGTLASEHSGGAAEYLKSEGFTIDYGRDLFEHATALATLVKKAQGTNWRKPWPTMRLFLETLSRAKHFVHFASWGVSHLMIGALKITSMRVPVYGFVSNVEEHARVELTEFPDEAPGLNAKVIPSRQGAWDAPHQKLIIVDGLLAFKGSTNLTNNAIRKADQGLDISESVTDFERVRELNNKYFAPVWKKLTHPEESAIVMWDVPF